MSGFSLVAFLSITGVLLLRGLRRAGHVYQFPFLAGAVMLGWVAPQAIGLLGDPRLPEGALARTLGMATLCAAAIYLGHRWRPRPFAAFDWSFSQRRLLYVAASLSVVGGYFAWKIRGLPEEMVVGAWQGLPVAYLFFAKLQYYAFALAAVLFARTGSRAALVIALFNFAFFLQPLFIGARRGVIIEVGLIVLLAAWFGRRWTVPRPAMVAAVAVGTLFVFSIGQYRGTVYEAGQYGGHAWRVPTVQEVLSIDYVGTFQQVLNEGANELRNAAYDIAATGRTLSFNFGAAYWNDLVQDFIPRQVVGAAFKESLKFPLPDVAYQVYGHVPHTGTTHTGFADSFRAFGYPGALVFFAIAWFMRSLYEAGLRGHLIAQVLYMVLITDSLLAITHNTGWFVTGLMHVTVFVLPALYLARRRRRTVPVSGPGPLPGQSIRLSTTANSK